MAISQTRSCWLVTALLSMGLVLSGCGEINDMLNAGKGEKPAAAGEKTTADTSGQSAREKLDAYYSRGSREVDQHPDDPVIGCRLRGATQYMRRSDCKLRGGSEPA